MEKNDFVKGDFKERLLRAISSVCDDRLNGISKTKDEYLRMHHIGYMPKELWEKIISGEYSINECCKMVREHNRVKTILQRRELKRLMIH